MPIRSVGGEFTVNSTLIGDQKYPVVYPLAKGRYIATWHSNDLYIDDVAYTYDGRGWIIRGRVFDADGSPVGKDFTLVQTVDWSEITSFQSLENGGFIAQWDTGWFGEGPVDVSIGNFDEYGRSNKVFNLSYDGLDSSLTRLSDGRFVSAWTTWEDVRAIILDRNGNPAGEEFQINATDTGNERVPMATALPDGKFFMAWQSDYELYEETPLDPDGVSIIGRFFNADGSPAGEDFKINSTATNAEFFPLNSVETQSDGTVLVTWWTYDEAGNETKLLLGQHLDVSGNRIGGEVIVEDHTGDPDDRSPLAFTELADGRTLATWRFYEGGPAVLHAILQNDSGTAISDEFTIDVPEYESLAALTDGRIAVSWSTGEGFIPSTVEGDIRAKIFNPKIFDGTPGDDFWTGGAFIDRINGGDGNDRLRGMEGADRIRGGNGDDFLDGSEGDDFLWGDAGNDILAGWTGIDTMTGGTGNDTYVVDRLEDVVLELAGEGIDTVQSYISLRLGAQVEHLLLKGRGDTYGFGNALANALTGNAGDNRLRGGDGADLLDGGRGADRLEGGAGRDRLIGGDGADRLFGGTGKDRFIFLDPAETGIGAARDSIRDFARGADLVDLSRIDADTTRSGNQAFDFRGAAAFSGDAGELRFAAGILSGDIDGDARADFEIGIAGIARLGDADILG